VNSKSGVGTQFIIHLPLTLAVTQTLMVRSDEGIYAIPAAMVEQVRQLKSGSMEALYRERQVEWQGKIYPLHYLPQMLGDTERVPANQPRNTVLLLHSGEQRIALHVDQLIGNQESVVKDIGPQLSRLAGIAGATVQGNGQVVLILNPIQMAQRIPTEVQKTGPTTAELLRSQPLVMVVDDSLTVRKITSRMLTRAGYQVVTAKDGVDALEQLAEISPAVMLLDVEMPRMDGFELAKQLRRDSKTKDLPIIMITSRTAAKHRDYALEIGVNAYLGKPFQEDEVLQRIAQFVGAAPKT
jgi:chemosensory pili system protein ChpA (sensor histidine kinase/response regulator)